jgi:hypothetical protein
MVTIAHNTEAEALVRSEFMIPVTFQGVKVFMTVQLCYSVDIQCERIKNNKPHQTHCLRMIFIENVTPQFLWDMRVDGGWVDGYIFAPK